MISFTYMSGFLAVLDGQPNLWGSLQYQLVGFFVVMIALASIWAGLEIIGFFFRQRAHKEAANKVPVSGSIVTDTSQGDDLDKDVVMVIAAAVNSVVTVPHRIVSISLADGGNGKAANSQGAWSAEGRRAHYDSHNVR
jgi:hypothetical protein